MYIPFTAQQGSRAIQLSVLLDAVSILTTKVKNCVVVVIHEGGGRVDEVMCCYERRPVVVAGRTDRPSLAHSSLLT